MLGSGPRKADKEQGAGLTPVGYQDACGHKTPQRYPDDALLRHACAKAPLSLQLTENDPSTGGARGLHFVDLDYTSLVRKRKIILRQRIVTGMEHA